ncbi:hypothetical protein [Neobacillus cucumis]|uniref:J domain-containing protein n=1 Tax=Neobacillus cucumis TaxID=1740721 RepID=A0A2N5HSE6_9BACI|nr:hypothetical protein [Neobacillus cucumis]PLS08446.1 hypothetical protein CVD27_03310 [Neobacillus cucumis]
MNTDQAFEFLKAAGLSEDNCVETVRRWLREKKIIYLGKGAFQQNDYIIQDTEEAINLLNDAGVAPSVGIQVVQRWLYEGKIQKVGNGNQLTEYIANVKNPKQVINPPSDQDKLIRELKAKVKVQDEHIKELEELHKSSVKTFIQQRNKLQKEILNLELEKNELQKETKKVLKDNIELRSELLYLKEKLSKQGKRVPEKVHISSSVQTLDYRKKLGLSKTASEKEVLTRYKKLLKITHPDHGGNPVVFHYVKTDYDHYKNGM